ncbi:type II secretion system F family protein [Subtercola vilae]|uniref:Type II secretion system protein GspF domain-containing protein n=1 Tax=Subtercola vilae TaxID=2056433 RepID=A0A4T2BPZ2_9MICO|nr:type II secretion system F family protein [Subtercola vilae]TIH33695.1 hypothetical protein D4765_14330 [Subtercola vilae]
MARRGGATRRGATAVGHGQVDEVAAVVQRLAVLLEAGVAPTNAWGYLAEGAGRAAVGRRGSVASAVGLIARAVQAGVAADRAIGSASKVGDPRTRQAWLVLAAAWQVASVSGAPLAVCLREVARTLLEVGEVHRSIDVALAAPIATARLMVFLPLVGIGFGALMGFDSLHTLFATPPGVACLVAGVGLLVVSRRWNSALVRAAQPKTMVAGVAVELMAVAMGGGASVDRARQVMTDALELYGLREPGAGERVDAVVELSRRAGVPAAELLRAEAAQVRRAAVTASQKRAAALSVRLMVPLGLCVLPAFMLLGVAPLLLAVITSTFSAL